MFQKPALLPYSGKESPTLEDQLDRAILMSLHHKNTQLVKTRAREQISPQVVTGQ